MKQPDRTNSLCIPMSRREILRSMSCEFGMLGLAGLLESQSLATASASTRPHHSPRAKRVIFLFLNGGPSHIDTFDPKPALRKVEGQQPTGELRKKTKGTGFMPSPLNFIRSGQSGIEISETL